MEHKAQPRARHSMASAGAATGRAASGRGCRRRICRRAGRSASRRSASRSSGRGWCRGATALEIGGIPARTLELEARSRELFLKLFSTAVWTHGQRCIGHLLQHITRMATGGAAISVNWHELTLGTKQEIIKRPRNQPCRRFVKWGRSCELQAPEGGGWLTGVRQPSPRRGSCGRGGFATTVAARSPAACPQ